METDDDDDPKVKALLDPATEADLARWFGLPSFAQLAEQPKPKNVVPPEIEAVRARRAKAIAAVDPAFVTALQRRNEDRPQTLLRFEATIDVHVDEHFGTIDEALVSRAGTIAEPREVEIPDQLLDDLAECTPQALLRDLHRAELYFDKMFEIVDFAAEQRVDAVAEVSSAMATRWTLPRLEASPLVESEALLAAARADRGRPWTDVLPALRNRRVTE